MKKRRGRLAPHQHKRMEARVNELASLVGMGNWRLSVDKAHCDEGYTAQVSILDHDEATISLAKDWHSLQRSEQDITLLHELFHCHADRLKSGYLNITKALLSITPKKDRNKVRKLLKPVMAEADKLEEQWVERMARTFLDISKN